MDLDRYKRHIQLPEFGEEGQRRVASSRVVVIGCGGLGGSVAMLLGRAGVGHMVLLDKDYPDRTNLHRQVLYDEEDVASRIPKALAAKRRLLAANPSIDVEAVVTEVGPSNVQGLIRGADLVIDGADSFELRLLVNEACVRAGVPWVHGAVLGTYGVQWTVIPGQTACYACLVGEAPLPGTYPMSDTVGVYAPTVMAVASVQAAEALKVLSGNRHRIRPTLLSFDLWANTKAEVHVARLAACPVCMNTRGGS